MYRRVSRIRTSHCGALAVLAALVTSAGLERSVTADLFDTHDPLTVELAAPFPAVFRQREADDREYQDAILTSGASGADAGVTVPLRVRVRGRSRAAQCDFPPLLLNFRKPDVVGTVFDGQDRLKLVTHCRTNASYDKYLRLEYLIYRVQALVTQYSLRARPIEAHYVDNGRARDMGTRPAILLEDEEQFGERHGMTMFEATRVDRARYDAEVLATLDVFQYLIGNTDWSAIDGPGEERCCHNVTPYVRADGTLVPVAYDFDSAGLVDAPHALPDERLPIRSVRQRLYRGQCRPAEELAPIFARFQQQRSAILALFTEQPGLDADDAERAREYIEEFYAVLADDKRRERAFFNACDH
jgi:hypothetical protein